MTTIPNVADALRDVLTTTADAAAAASGFVQRRSKLSGALFVQTLALGWLEKPLAGLQTLCLMASRLGVEISPQGLEQRFTPRAVTCLQAVLAAAVQQVVASAPVAIPILRRFCGVYVQDSTSVALPAAFAADWPGCGNASTPAAASASMKLQVRLELTTGTLAGPTPHPGRVHDRAAPLVGPTLPPEALFLADLGYFRLAHLRELATAGVFWLTRLQVQTAVFDATGARLDLLPWLRRQASQPLATVDVPVSLGVKERVPARLLAIRVPQEISEARRRKLHAEVRRRGHMVSQDRLDRADWTLFVTNVPPERLTLQEALVVARARWHIELLFKLWKSHGQLDASRSQQDARRLCELLAKLLAMLIQHWLLLVSCWQFPDRSLVRAAEAVRSTAILLATTLRSRSRLIATIHGLGSLLAHHARIDRRRQRPGSWQLLLDLDPPPLDRAPLHAVA